MFGTVILDAYKQEEANQIAEALEDLCAPTDSYGWASAGIYSFWDYQTRETLYIGLASDLAIRFKQHNGILPLQSGSKQAKIEEYFTTHPGGKLGYSIFVQSPLSQPLVNRNRTMYEAFAQQEGSPVEDMLSEEGRKDIRIVEGILIEAYRKANGKFPSWNEVGGSIHGQNSVMPNNFNIVKAFCHPEAVNTNPIMSRSTLRELTENATYAWYESYLHSVRQCVLMLGMDFDDALNFMSKWDRINTLDRMREDGYFQKALIV